MYDEIVMEILQTSEQLKDDTLHLERDKRKGITTQSDDKVSSVLLQVNTLYKNRKIK